MPTSARPSENGSAESKWGRDGHAAFAIDEAGGGSGAAADGSQPSAELRGHRADRLELRRNTIFPCLSMNPQRFVYEDGGEPFVERRSAVELGSDRELTFSVDVPRASADRYGSEAVGKGSGLVELWGDLHLSPAVDVPEASILADEEQAASLFAGTRRFDAVARGEHGERACI